jgi:hypothetical protein
LFIAPFDDWRKIPITLIDPEKGEQTAQATSGPPDLTGYNVPVHHTEASVRARIFVEQAYSAELTKLGKEFREKFGAVQNELAARGVILSGLTTMEMARLNGEMITALVAKRLQLWLESSSRFGVSFTDDVAREILDDVLTVRSTQIQGALKVGARVGGQELPGGSGDSYFALIEQHVAIDAAVVRTEIERHRFPLPNPDASTNHVTHHTEVHIHSSTVGNLNLGSQIGTINAALQQISQSDPALVEALKTLTEQITESRALRDESKRESVEAIAEILKQAQLKPEERSKFTVRGALDLLMTTVKAVPELALLVEKYWPVIRAHFGL